MTTQGGGGAHEAHGWKDVERMESWRGEGVRGGSCVRVSSRVLEIVFRGSLGSSTLRQGASKFWQHFPRFYTFPDRLHASAELI